LNDKTRAIQVSAPLVLCVILLTVPAFAATITVNSLADPGRLGICALRDAITAANTKHPTRNCRAGTGTDTIQFSVRGTINLAGALPDVTDRQLSITGPIVISGQNRTKIISVGIGATLHLIKLTMTRGLAAFDPVTGDFEGGALWNAGTVTLYNTTFSSNTATSIDATGFGTGGAIYNKGTLTSTNSSFTNNQVDFYGGALYNIGNATINHSNFSQNQGGVSGGAIANAGRMNIALSTINNNQDVCCCGNCGNAGGIWNIEGASLKIATSTILGNFSGDNAGAIDNEGALTISQSLIANNIAEPNANGGGRAGGIASGPNLLIVNSTISGNCVGLGQNGGCAMAGGILTQGGLIINSTITRNSASSDPDVCEPPNGNGVMGTVTLKNTIVAGNFILSDTGNTVANCLGMMNDQGYNLADDNSCAFTAHGSRNNVNAKLAAGIANNGGPTETIALLMDSPAIDAIPLAACTDQTGKRIITDQRGFPRPDAGEAVCDIGAYESAF